MKRLTGNEVGKAMDLRYYDSVAWVLALVEDVCAFTAETNKAAAARAGD